MFNDLIEDLEANRYDVFAYADDLAITGIGEERLDEAIRICET